MLQASVGGPVAGCLCLNVGFCVKSPQPEPAGGQWAVARYDFTAEAEQELSLRQGDHILVTEHVDADWCSGRLCGKEGIFPVAFVEFCTGE